MRLRTFWAGVAWAGCALLLTLVAIPVARAASPSVSDPVIRQAGDLIEWGRWKEARELLAQAVAAPDPPGEEAARAARSAFYAHILLQFGDLDQALKLTKQAVASDGDCALCHLYRFEAMAQRAKTLSQIRAYWQLSKMKHELEKAESLDPTLGDVQWAWIDLDLGLPALAGGSSKDAYLHADRLAALDPVDGWLARATIATSDKKPDQALEDYRKAASQDTADPRGSFALGKAFYERAEYAQAAEALAHAFELNRRSVLYSGYYAANLARMNKFDQAKAVLASGQKEHPNSRLGDFLVAQALREQNRNFAWAKQLLAGYLAVPAEPGQASADEARKLLASLG